MELSLTVYGVNCTQGLTCLYLVACLYRNTSQLAVECEMISMLEKHALIVARHDDDLFNNTIKYGLDLRALGQSYIYTVIRREFKVLIYRM